MIDVVESGSSGNAVVYFDKILVDCGVPLKRIKGYVNDIKLILLTHEHSDHINLSTVINIQKEHPSVRVGCCEWMIPKLKGVKNIDLYEVGSLYDYGLFKVSPVKLYHDVQNCGYRIFANGKKVIHCTDTRTLEGIEAKDYDLYAIEHNYNEDTVMQIIAKADKEGRFTHVRGSINSHLSEQQARDFIYKNRKDSSQVVRLHESKTAL